MRSHHRQSFPLSSHRFDIRHLGPFPAIVLHRLIGFLATAIAGVFIPIFVYEFVGGDLRLFFLWFAIGMGLRIPLFTFAAKVFSKTGLKASLVVGVCMWMLYYFGVYLLEANAFSFPSIVLFCTFLAQALHYAFYWTPYHVDFAEVSKKGHRGREVGIMYALQRLVSIAGPVIGGGLIAAYSYSVAFFVGIGLIALSLLPIFFFPSTQVRYEFGYFETFKKMFSKKYRLLTLSMAAMGVESSVGYAIWPVFLFLIFQGDYLQVGAFSGVIILIGMVLQLFVGSLTDKKTPQKLLRVGVDVYSLGWIVKAFVTSVFGVFAASTFHTFGSILMKTPLDAMTYEKAADSGHYVDEFTTMREIALTFGRSGVFLIMFAIAPFVSLSVAFLIAGITSLAITFFARVKVGKLVAA